MALEAENYKVVKAGDGFFCLESVKTKKLYLVLLDTGLPYVYDFKTFKINGTECPNI